MRTFPRVFPTQASTRALLLMLPLALGGCAGGAAAPPTEAEPLPGARGVPGFDTRVYPGDDVMSAWRASSPYRWVGFYLPAPCYTGTSWEGKRDRLRDQGWGVAVLFVGEQDWPMVPDSMADAGVDEEDAPEGPRCTRENLSAGNGRADGEAAAAAARAEGFPAGTVIYLDVEPVDSVSEPLREYVQAWTTGLMEAGFRPGLYAHARNAEELLDVVREAVPDGALAPRLWVARPVGFSLRRGPSESGFPADVWQGELDVDETWGGHTVRIDVNVADTVNPSG